MSKPIKDEFQEALTAPGGDERRSNFVYSWNGQTNIPKNIDYASFFLQCPIYDGADDIEEEPFYDVDWNSSHSSTVDTSILTVFLVSRFVLYMKDIVRSGLKKGYVIKEENLKSKVKGRILHGPNIRKNVIPGHQERLFCSFQEYTVDIPINRILKATLSLCRDIIANQSNSVIFHNAAISEEIQTNITHSLSFMHNVGQESQPARASGKVIVPHGKLFKNYEEAMKLARILLQLEDSYFISGQKTRFSILPDFWIYLPTLFEHYVYGKMKKGKTRLESELLIQKKGSYGQRADFILKNPPMVIDAKYKWWYESIPKSKWNDFRDDLRELSGYTRDTVYFDNTKDCILCIIIYPVSKTPITNNPDDSSMLEQMKQVFSDDNFGPIEPIPGINGFYKIGLILPSK